MRGNTTATAKLTRLKLFASGQPKIAAVMRPTTPFTMPATPTKTTAGNLEPPKVPPRPLLPPLSIKYLRRRRAIFPEVNSRGRAETEVRGSWLKEAGAFLALPHTILSCTSAATLATVMPLTRPTDMVSVAGGM